MSPSVPHGRRGREFVGMATALERGPGEPVEADPKRRRPRTFSEPKLSTDRRITSSRRRHSGSRSPRARPPKLGRKMGIEPMPSGSHPDVLTVELHPPWAHPVDDVGRDLRRPRVAGVVERGGFEPPKVFQLIYSQPPLTTWLPLHLFAMGPQGAACSRRGCVASPWGTFGAPASARLASARTARVLGPPCSSWFGLHLGPLDLSLSLWAPFWAACVGAPCLCVFAMRLGRGAEWFRAPQGGRGAGTGVVSRPLCFRHAPGARG